MCLSKSGYLPKIREGEELYKQLPVNIQNSGKRGKKYLIEEEEEKIIHSLQGVSQMSNVRPNLT